MKRKRKKEREGESERGDATQHDLSPVVSSLFSLDNPRELIWQPDPRSAQREGRR